MTLCYQYSNMAPIEAFGSEMIFLKFLLSLHSQKRLEYKENTAKLKFVVKGSDPC